MEHLKSLIMILGLINFTACGSSESDTVVDSNISTNENESAEGSQSTDEALSVEEEEIEGNQSENEEESSENELIVEEVEIKEERSDNEIVVVSEDDDLYLTVVNNSMTSYEDAEDDNTNGWSVENSPSNEARVFNAYDTKSSSKVINFNSTSMYDSYRFTFPKEDKEKKVLKWSMASNLKLYSFEVLVQTSKGSRTLKYTPTDTGNGMSNGNSVINGLGSDADNGEWHTHVRDLSMDLQRYEADNTIVSVQGLRCYGDGAIDNIELYENEEGLDITTPITISAPGIVLTFDDSFIEDWYKMKETFLSKGVVTTLFCNGWESLSESQVAQFKELEDDGHEIAVHTVNHRSTYDAKYNDVENKAQAYLDEEVIPSIDSMNNDSFTPQSFSYPYISGQPKHSELIREYLPHIREAFASVKQIDNPAETTYSLENIKKELQRIKNNQDIGVFLAHRIIPEGEPGPTEYRITTEKLTALIDEANRLGLRFYTMEEAHRIYTNQ